MFSLEFSVIHQKHVFGPKTPYGRCGCVAIPSLELPRTCIVTKGSSASGLETKSAALRSFEVFLRESKGPCLQRVPSTGKEVLIACNFGVYI